ncbi:MULTISPECIES: glycoside hydrolase family 32 protein [Pseudarthrobacter]|uniref:Levanbiose-producing levanase n=1 Tax=Pseudarthrobacter niigatensis TaxID=369935 RepID=A0AAJ1STJ8_9MICC|nr:glycoside hydrolase family 32 protein [Pseudarthrobacter sp. NIBRBAC000502771]MDQ0144621.1 levanbiose-producing levanase [Pseudarthrobacter niigatensis]MDQ0265267.1 levanbiose-producing levanase [Pseudarthrobacter niigatensis]
MENSPAVSRRALLNGSGAVVLTGSLALSMPFAQSATAAPPNAPDTAPAKPPYKGPTRMRPTYHFSVPDNWKNDPQRPIYIDGEYHYYYLYNADYLQGGGGTSWRRATTTDHVSFRDRGVAIPKFSNGNGDCWSGCLVIDERNTAGYGENAVVALVTQAPQGRQAQYLWYSTDRGRSFQPGGTAPVLPNPGVQDFRDPKVIWDADRGQWFMVNAEGQKLGFYTSPNLRSWRRVGEFVRTDLGLLECPDLFRMTADDGTSHWILGTSANGKGRGLPATYAYWTGAFNGITFAPDHAEPEWLDYGYDFYGAVTYPHHDASGAEDATLRRALGWANFWDYPHNTPTLATDAYNGDDMIVRDIRLKKADGSYHLVSTPTTGLANHIKRTHHLGDVKVTGTHDLDISSPAYDLTCELVWDPAAPPSNIGLEICRASGGGRHVAAGAFLRGPFAYVNRRPTINPTGGESQTPIDPSAGRLTLRLLVDRTSVEMFVGDGRVVHSHRVFPLEGDNNIRLYANDGTATFSDLTINEINATT